MKKIIHFVSGPAVLFFVWYSVSALHLVEPFFLPGPLVTIKKFFQLLISGNILPDLFATLFRLGLSFLIAVLVGVPLGLMLGFSKKLYRHVEFLIDFFRSLPASALFPLFLILFGAADWSKIAVVAFASTLIVIFHTAYGVLHSSKTRTLATRLMGVNHWQLFCHVTWWETLPHTLVGLRHAVSLSLAVIIVTEMFVGTAVGLGRRIIDFQITYEMPNLYATILLAGLVGYLSNLVFIFLEARAVHWNGRV